MHARPHSTIARDRRQKAFSLIELLVVIAIMAILIAAAVPVFSNTQNNARQASREIIKAHLQQARAHAIAASTPTAVAIPVLASGGDLGARAVSLFEVELDGNSYVPLKDAAGKDRLLQRWTILPGNFHFLGSAQLTSGQATIVDSPETMPAETKGRALTCHIIVFSPNGQIVRPAGTIQIATAQAARSGNTLTPTQKNDGKPVSDLLQVNRLTGRTRFVEP
ncbi:prepilin-type N-terminal cleavage/methylation domain-containing protein [Akkermansiaceae bacterium]|nr:prepilin-type N-terminal cleavage/methylation domain-containing protein [Akkermansiaceae bacterium]